MLESQIQRTYRAAPYAVFGACLAALGQLGGRITQYDAERGTIAAELGSSPLALQIGQAGPNQARLVVSSHSPKRGTRRALATLIELVDRVVPLA